MDSRIVDRWAVATARWLRVPVSGTKMDRINVAGYFLLGARVHALLGLKTGMQIAEVLPMLADADEYLDMFVNVTKGPKGEQSRPVAQELQKGLELLTLLPPRLAKAGLGFNLAGRVLSDKQVSLITKLVEQFEAVFCSETPTMGIFYVTPKRAYSTEILLNKAETVLDATDLDYLPGLTTQDMRRAGTCLLFDQFTAAGFHSMRAVEAVARSYYFLITGAEPVRIRSSGHRESFNLGQLVDGLQVVLDRLKLSKQSTGLLGIVVPVLERLTKIYRNPIMHPEMVLDEHDAVDVFDLTKTAISNMTSDIRKGGSHFSISASTFAWQQP